MAEEPEERLEEEDTPELLEEPELLFLSTELLAPELLSAAPDRAERSVFTVPELRSGRDSVRDSIRDASGLAEPALSAALSDVVGRDGSITLPEEGALSEVRDDSVLLSGPAALSEEEEREDLPAVASLSGADEREEPVLLSE